MTKKEKTISLRVKKYLFDFLNQYVEGKDFDKTDVITKLIENFYMDIQKGENLDKVMNTEMIFVAVDRKMKDFLEKMAKDCGVSARQLVIDILTYFLLGYLTNSFDFNYAEMKKKFTEKKVVDK